MALSVTHLRTRFLHEPIGVGGKVPRDFRAIAQELFDRIGKIWAPDCDEEQLVRLLSDRSQLQALAAGAPVVEEHPSLGYAPVSFQTIARIAAAALWPKYDQLAAISHKEDAEWRASAAQLRAERKKQGFFKDHEGAIKPLEVAVARERYEAMAALESLYESADTAVDAFPPFRIRSALRPLLPELNLPTTTRELVLDPDSGKLISIPSLSTRILLGHALSRLVRRTNEVFPGLLDLIEAPPKTLQRKAKAASPFREAGAKDAVAHGFSEDQLFTALDKADVFRSLDQSLLHASMLGRLKLLEPKAKARVKVVDMLNIFQQSPAEQKKHSLRGRRNWHAETLLMLTRSMAGYVHERARHYLPLELYRLVCGLHDAASALRALLVARKYDPLGLMEPLARLEHQGGLFAALTALSDTLARSTRLAGSALQLAERVAAAMRTSEPGSPFPGTSADLLHQDHLVRCLVFTFRSRAGLMFADQLERYQALIHHAYENALRSHRAEAAVTVFERIDFFTKSPSELERDHSASLSKEQLAEAQKLFTAIHEQLDGALRAYPPGRCYFGLSTLLVAAQRIQAVAEKVRYGKNNHHWQAALIGREDFLSALYQWNGQTMRGLCAMVSPAQVLERYTLRSLTEAS